MKIRCMTVTVFIYDHVPLVLFRIKVNCALKYQIIRLSSVVCIITVKIQSQVFFQLYVIQHNVLCGPNLFEIVPATGARVWI